MSRALWVIGLAFAVAGCVVEVHLGDLPPDGAATARDAGVVVDATAHDATAHDATAHDATAHDATAHDASASAADGG